MAEHPERPKDMDKIRNTLERRAHLIVDLLEDRAQRIVDSMDEPPPGTEEPDAQRVRDMWSFSPFGERAPEVFWTLHDLGLEKFLGEIARQPVSGAEKFALIRKAYQTAETAALSRVYPQRMPLMMLGITTPERSVKLAERAQRLVEQEDKRQGTPEPEPVAAY